MLKIIDECTKVGLPEPEFKYDCNGLMLLFNGKPATAAEKASVEVAGNGGKMSGENVGETSGKTEEASVKRRENGGKTSGERREKF